MVTYIEHEKQNQYSNEEVLCGWLRDEATICLFIPWYSEHTVIYRA